MTVSSFKTMPRCFNVSFQVLRRDLVQALRKKRPDIDLDKVIFHQDNAPAHRANSTLLEISLLGFELLQHPPYSPDLAPMDFRVFPEVKKMLRGKHFDTSFDLKIETQKIIANYSSDWYSDIYQKWVYRHRKCVATHGDYVEKVNRELKFDVAT